MELQEQLQIAARLLPYLYKNNETGILNIDVDAKQELKKLYQDLHHVQPNVGCGSCILHYLTMIEAWYERENPKCQSEPKN